MFRFRNWYFCYLGDPLCSTGMIVALFCNKGGERFLIRKKRTFGINTLFLITILFVCINALADKLILCLLNCWLLWTSVSQTRCNSQLESTDYAFVNPICVRVFILTIIKVHTIPHYTASPFVILTIEIIETLRDTESLKWAYHACIV